MISASYVSACLDVGRGEVIRYLASGISSHPARGLPPPHDTITSYWAPTTCGSQIVAPQKKSKTLPKALRTQASTALTSNFGLVWLVRFSKLHWLSLVWFCRFGLVLYVWFGFVGLVWFGRISLVGLVW